MTDSKMDKVRELREATLRSQNERRKPWEPPSALDAPKPPEGFAHRWIRSEARGQDDKLNVHAKMREGWELVRAEEYPDFAAPTIEDGQHAGIIGSGGLMLARIPIETIRERTEYYGSRTRNQMEAVNQNLRRNENSVMPIHTDNKSTLEFGGRKDIDSE